MKLMMSSNQPDIAVTAAFTVGRACVVSCGVLADKCAGGKSPTSFLTEPRSAFKPNLFLKI
jgi:hypothetical protein